LAILIYIPATAGLIAATAFLAAYLWRAPKAAPPAPGLKSPSAPIAKTSPFAQPAPVIPVRPNAPVIVRREPVPTPVTAQSQPKGFKHRFGWLWPFRKANRRKE